MAPKSDITGIHSKMKVHDIKTHGGYIRVRANPHGHDEYIPLKANIIGLAPRAKAALVAKLNGSPLSAADVGEYGRKLTTDNIKYVLDKMMSNNVALAASGRSTIPICIWGSHGLGKTSIVRDICHEHGWDYKYIAPAQFEEMGDLHGFPVRTGVTDEEAAKGRTKGTMSYYPPEWVPREVPAIAGVLLVDDFNRADPRILNGLMQLFQDGELAGWKLPKNYMIIATANPSSAGDYSVGQLDPAQMTRMLHVELQFNMRAWMKWANSLDKNGQTRVDPRAIPWMEAHGEQFLSQPEKYQRTTPRSLDQLFTQIRPIKSWSKDEDLVATYAYAAIDRQAADSFMEYAVVTEAEAEENILVNPPDLLFADPQQFAQIMDKFRKSAYDNSGIRKTDKINATVDAIVQFVLANADNVNSEYCFNPELIDQSTPGQRGKGKSAMPLETLQVKVSDLAVSERDFITKLDRQRLSSRGVHSNQGGVISISDISWNIPSLRGYIQESVKPDVFEQYVAKLNSSVGRVNRAFRNSPTLQSQEAKILAAIKRKETAKRNFVAFMMSKDIPAEQVLKVVDEMTRNAGTIPAPSGTEGEFLKDKWDSEEGFINKEGPNLVLDVGIVEKAVGANASASANRSAQSNGANSMLTDARSRFNRFMRM